MIDVRKLHRSSALLWAEDTGLQVRPGSVFSVAGRPYLPHMLDFSKYRRKHIIKGTQSVGATTAFAMLCYHHCYFRIFNQDVIYAMPTEKTVRKLARVAFDPMADCLGDAVSHNSVEIKSINGRNIHFVGGKEQYVAGTTERDSDSARSTPADFVICDEVDKIDEHIHFQFNQRLNESVFKWRANFGSPTIPGFGIDRMYYAGTQDCWDIPCECGKWTCLEEVFPDGLDLVDGVWRRVCVHCGRVIDPLLGEFHSRVSDANEQSMRISCLSRASFDVNQFMLDYLGARNDDERAELERSVVARAVRCSDSQLSPDDIYDLCTMETMSVGSSEITAMGVDVNKPFRVVIGKRLPNERMKVIYIGEPEDEQALYDLAIRFNVRHLGICNGPDIYTPDRILSMFRKNNYHLQFWRVYYSGNMAGGFNHDARRNLMTVNRLKTLDETYAMINDGRISFPRRDKMVDAYALSMTKLARMEEVNKLGIRSAHWVAIGDKSEHFFHATNYMRLVALNMGLTSVSEEIVTRHAKPYIDLSTNSEKSSGILSRIAYNRNKYYSNILFR